MYAFKEGQILKPSIPPLRPQNMRKCSCAKIKQTRLGTQEKVHEQNVKHELNRVNKTKNSNAFENRVIIYFASPSAALSRPSFVCSVLALLFANKRTKK